MWLPEGPGGGWLFACSNAAAVAAGLTFRPTAETARDALEHGTPGKEPWVRQTRPAL